MSTAARIPRDEIVFSEQSLVDEVGRVFFWQGRIFRGIRESGVPAVRALLASGLIEELTNSGLFPRTGIAELELEGFALLLEHQRISPLSYPCEWSFEMLKAAALAVLAIQTIAARYGYELKDAHPYNVLFQGGQPVWVDLGSFRVREPGSRGWRAYEEFVQWYLYTLTIWSTGDNDFARRALSDSAPISHQSYLLYRHPLARRFPGGLRLINYAFYLYYKGRLLSAYPTEFIRQNSPLALERLVEPILALRERGFLPFQSVDLAALTKRTEAIGSAQRWTMWGDYHDELERDDGSTPRFDRVIALVKDLGITDAVELAGNRGTLASLLLQRAGVERVTCTDFDGQALDQAFKLSRSTKGMTTALVNFIAPTVPAGCALPAKRLRATAVLALAVTHHLILKPPFYSMEHVLEAIGDYASRYMLVEFMPLGLWNRSGKNPTPANYTRENFRAALAKIATVLHEEEIDENRLLFIGEKQQTSS